MTLKDQEQHDTEAGHLLAIPLVMHVQKLSGLTIAPAIKRNCLREVQQAVHAALDDPDEIGNVD